MTAAAATASATAENDQAHLLHIYLRDHEAAGVGGLQLFTRCAKANHGTRYATELRRLTSEIRADLDSLRTICRDFDVSFSTVGRAFAYTGATLGRVKTNGRAFKYSPLSRVIELEAMSSGVKSKLHLWESLLRLVDSEPRLNEADLKRHAADAEQQLVAIRELHDMAVDEAFDRAH